MSNWTKAWVTWAVLAIGSFAMILAAIEIGPGVPRGTWTWWAIPSIGGGAVIEVAAIVNRARNDTLSEHVWALVRGAKSLAVTFVLWLAWLLVSNDAWPSVAIFFLLWAAYHFTFEGPKKERQAE